MGLINGVESDLPMVGDGAQIGDGNTNEFQSQASPIITTSAAALTCTKDKHGGRTVVLSSTHTQTITLPAASGSGAKYRFVVKTVGTDGSKVIKVANATDVMQGVHIVNSTSTAEASSFLTSATSDTITLDNTTTGGIVGTTVSIEDIASGIFNVRVDAAASGSVATSFSAAVS